MNSKSLRSGRRGTTQNLRFLRIGNIMYRANALPLTVLQPTQLLRMMSLAIAALVLALTAMPVAHTQTYTVLYNFSPGTKSGDPSSPQSSGIIAQGHDGNLYSTTPDGGTLCSFCGVVFKITPSGALTHVFDFNYPNGAGYTPYSGLTLGTDGNFYGTTAAGGNFNGGTVFKISASGNLAKLYDFGTCKYPCKEGVYPKAPPVEGRDGNFYGTTPHTIDGTDNGVIYKVTPAGKFATIYPFDGTSGGNPNDPLILGTDGNFYGTTAKGGKTIQPACWADSPTCGTVFKITPGGRVTFLYKFDQTHGAGPLGPLVQGSDGNFYGTTSAGGDANGDGVIFKITPLGKLTVLHALDGSVDGKQPSAGLVQVTDGKGNTVAFYGATTAGGSKGFGTLYKVSLSGAFTRIYDFDNATGATPEVTLFQSTSGMLYGETFKGGSGGAGTFYSLDDKLPPFVSLVSTSGKVGDSIEILGQGFNGTTDVSFNGKAASFKVVSDTYLNATVPSGASKGSVTVKTSTGTVTSNHIFIVIPHIKSFNPTSGKVGTPVVITGTTFTGATKVTFGGVASTNFKGDSDTQVTATVPNGAVTGKIGITTPAGTATSSGIFTVQP